MFNIDLVVGYSSWHVSCHVPPFILPVPHNILKNIWYKVRMLVCQLGHFRYIMWISNLIPSSRPSWWTRYFTNTENSPNFSPGHTKVLTARQRHGFKWLLTIVWETVVVESICCVYKSNQTSSWISEVN